jgi:hypothetical protein
MLRLEARLPRLRRRTYGTVPLLGAAVRRRPFVVHQTVLRVQQSGLRLLTGVAEGKDLVKVRTASQLVEHT